MAEQLTNLTINGAYSVAGWNSSAGTNGAATRVSVDGELIYTQTTSNTASSPGPYLREYWDIAAEEIISVRLKVKAAAGRNVSVSLTVRNVTPDVIGVTAPTFVSNGQYQEVVIDNIVVPSVGTYLQIWPKVLNANLAVGEEIRVRDILIVNGPQSPSYFNGGTAIQPTDNASVFTHGWLGAAYASRSVRTLVEPHDWTRRWWDSLPNAYRMADAVQDPSVGYFPLLRWMNGIGALAGQMRDLSDDIWNWALTDIERMPDEALRWVAQLLGMSADQRAVSLPELRTALRELTASGRRAVGTRSSIAEVAKRFLTGEKQIGVVPSSTTPHTIVLLVRAAEVPGGDLAALAESVRSAGVIPAGHNVIAVNAVATWDSFMAAAGVTWDEKDAKAKTWAQHDTLGVVLS